MTESVQLTSATQLHNSDNTSLPDASAASPTDLTASATGAPTPSTDGVTTPGAAGSSFSQTQCQYPLGPASKTWAIPPRKKPGRKPLKSLGTSNDTEERRRAQNREAQKNFRARRNGKETELSAQLTDAKKELATCRAERHEDQRRFALAIEQEREGMHRHYMTRINSLEEELRKTRRLLDEANAYQPTPMVQHPPQSQLATPTHESDMDMEIDMTNYGRTKGSSKTLYGTSKHCGFCSDSTACVCKEAAMQAEMSPPPLTSEDAMPKPDPYAKTAPGGCDACLRDPEQAKRCRELAQYAQKSAVAPHGIMPKPELASPSDRIACYDFVPRLPSIRDAIFQSAFSKMHTYPYSGETGLDNRDNPNKLPALEVDAAEAATVLANLANTPTAGPSSRPPGDNDKR